MKVFYSNIATQKLNSELVSNVYLVIVCSEDSGKVREKIQFCYQKFRRFYIVEMLPS